MLGQPQLPLLVRSRILEYVDQKCEGLYGHTSLQRRRFAAALTAQSRSSDEVTGER
jgi:hypothetical protein